MCYTVPIAGAVITSIAWGRTKNVKLWWLNLMLYGGAIFGFVDHLWNGELFIISDKIAKDLLLGVTITISILGIWGAMLIISKLSPTLNTYVSVKAD